MGRTGVLSPVGADQRRSATPTACATSAEMALGLRQTSHSAGHWRFLPPFFFCGCWCNFFQRPLVLRCIKQELTSFIIKFMWMCTTCAQVDTPTPCWISLGACAWCTCASCCGHGNMFTDDITDRYIHAYAYWDWGPRRDAGRLPVG